jgi:hypothetical protein
MDNLGKGGIINTLASFLRSGKTFVDLHQRKLIFQEDISIIIV